MGGASLAALQMGCNKNVIGSGGCVGFFTLMKAFETYKFIAFAHKM